jgi:mannosyltransferase
VRRGFLWIAVALALVAFALRIYRLDFVSLRGDESFTVLFAAQPLPELVEGIRNVEPNPPLYYLVLRGAMGLFGEHDFSARFVSAFFGVLAIPLLYQLGRALVRNRHLGQAAGLAAALLLAINPYQIWHSQDVRNYTLWPALSLASLYFLLQALRQNRRRLWIAYAFTALLSLYTHYYDVFVVLFENIFVFLLYWRDRAVLKRWIAVQGALAVLYLPWPLLLSSRPFTYVDATAYVPGLLGILRQGLSIFSLGETLPQGLVTLLLPALAVLAILGLGFVYLRDRRAFAFLVLYLLIPSFCVFVLTRWRPLFRDRYLNVIAPGYYLAFALGLVALTRVRRGQILAGIAGLALVLPAGLSLANYYFDPAYAKSADWRGLAAYLEAHAGADDVIVENYPDPTLAYYYQGPAERVVLPDRSAVDRVGDLPVNRKATGTTLQRLLAQHRRLWLIPYRSEWDPEGYVEGWLARRAHQIQEEEIDVFRVVAYERQPASVPVVEHVVASPVGDAFVLMGYNVATEGDCRLEEGGAERSRLLVPQGGSCTVHLTLHWQDVALADADYTVFAHLLGPDGQIAGQRDGQPQDGTFPTTAWFPGDVVADERSLAVPADATPGEYVLEVGMYLLETGVRLPAYDAAGRPWPDDVIRLDLPILVAP